MKLIIFTGTVTPAFERDKLQVGLVMRTPPRPRLAALVGLAFEDWVAL